MAYGSFRKIVAKDTAYSKRTKSSIAQLIDCVSYSPMRFVAYYIYTA